MSYPWYTHVKVEISGRALKGDAPVDMTLRILDSGVVAGSAQKSGVVLGQEYFIELELGGVNGNEAGLNMGLHTLKGHITLSNDKGTETYETESRTIAIGQVPGGVVT